MLHELVLGLDLGSPQSSCVAVPCPILGCPNEEHSLCVFLQIGADLGRLCLTPGGSGWKQLCLLLCPMSMLWSRPAAESCPLLVLSVRGLSQRLALSPTFVNGAAIILNKHSPTLISFVRSECLRTCHYQVAQFIENERISLNKTNPSYLYLLRLLTYVTVVSSGLRHGLNVKKKKSIWKCNWG